MPAERRMWCLPAVGSGPFPEQVYVSCRCKMEDRDQMVLLVLSCAKVSEETLDHPCNVVRQLLPLLLLLSIYRLPLFRPVVYSSSIPGRWVFGSFFGSVFGSFSLFGHCVPSNSSCHITVILSLEIPDVRLWLQSFLRLPCCDGCLFLLCLVISLWIKGCNQSGDYTTIKTFMKTLVRRLKWNTGKYVPIVSNWHCWLLFQLFTLENFCLI